MMLLRLMVLGICSDDDERSRDVAVASFDSFVGVVVLVCCAAALLSRALAHC